MEPMMENAIPVTRAEAMGIDFNSAEYGYQTTAADQAETPEKAAEMEVAHG